MIARSHSHDDARPFPLLPLCRVGSLRVGRGDARVRTNVFIGFAVRPTSLQTAVVYRSTFANLDRGPTAQVAFLPSSHNDSPRGINMRAGAPFNIKQTLSHSRSHSHLHLPLHLTTMKFATTSSIIVLAFSFLQLAYSLPVPRRPHQYSSPVRGS
ncbi:hypothetical protein EDB84DRAFT_358423 [Lactarius hengduanensis]|nr:hypothetical protein EDB84DRAFT_358423 [Lactarius hengduanensis]